MTPPTNCTINSHLHLPCKNLPIVCGPNQQTLTEDYQPKEELFKQQRDLTQRYNFIDMLLPPQDPQKSTDTSSFYYAWVNQMSQEVLNFCLRERILKFLPVAVEIIESSFPFIYRLDLRLEQDPEAEEEWLVLDITVQGEIDEILEQYDTYTRLWVSSVPWWERDKIRLSYNVL